MPPYSSDPKIADAPAYEIPQQMAKGVLTTPFIILLLCMVPDISLLAVFKPLVAVVLLFLTLSAVLGAFAGNIRVPGRKIFLAFSLVTVLNFFNVLVYHGPVLRWMRMAFCSYIFVAVFFFIVQKVDTHDLRDRLWRILVYFICIASLLDFITVANLGVADSFKYRATGGRAFTLTALMLLFPIFGSALEKKKFLPIFFFINLFLLLLSASRGVYLIILMGTIYTLIFVQKKFTYRFLFLILVLIVGAVIVSTPIYERMADRFSSAASGHDTSVERRMDETTDAIAEATKTWATLLFGKGYGILWKASIGGDLPGGYQAEAPHNDYAARLLYCGLVGLAVQLLLYLTLGLNLRRALKRTQITEVDPYTKVRLHGALLVLIAMMMQGMAGGVFYNFNNNVYEAFIFGMALSDAMEIFSRKRP